MSEMVIAAESLEAALNKVQERYQVPRDMIEVIEVSESQDTLEGAPPLEVNVTLRLNIDYVCDLARRRVQELLEIMEVKAEVRSRINRNIIQIELVSDQSALLIGKNGQNLDAIQHLVNRMIGKGGRGIPLVLIDIERYRQKQFTRVSKLAETSAKRVIRTREKVILTPMPPEERKIVHNVVKSFNGLKTYSMGSEGNRHVVIEPA